MKTQVPLIAYFEGTTLTGDTLYNYISSIDLQITALRVQSRDGQAMEVNLLKNGVLFDVVDITGIDSGILSIPKINFSGNDNLTIQVATAPGAPLEGLTFTFTCTVQDSVDSSALTNSKRIQTPFTIRYEGELNQGDTCFTFNPTNRIGCFGYTITLRNAANQQVTLNLKNNRVTVCQLILASGVLYQTGLISAYFNPGDVLTIQLAQTGIAPNFGESMLLLLDYQTVDQISFSNFQTPFIVEYEGLTSSASNAILKYICPRQMTLAALQLFVRVAIADNILVGIYKNGTIQSTIPLTSGNTQSQPAPLTLSYNQGDLLELDLIQPSSTSSGLVVTLDYFIDAGGNNASYVYYADPDSDIVMLARQVGIGGKRADAIPLENLDKYKRDVQNILDGRLRALYRVPLTKLNAGNNPFPGAIQLIAQRMTLRLLLNDIYSEVEPNTSGNVERLASIANEDLMQILNKQIILSGQRQRSRNSGSCPYTEPLAPNQPSTASTSSSLFPQS